MLEEEFTDHLFNKFGKLMLVIQYIGLNCRYGYVIVITIYIVECPISR